MRILNIIPSAQASYGGPATMMIETIDSLNALGHESEVLCVDPPEIEQIPSINAKVTRFGPGKFGFGYAPGIRKWIVKNGHQFDVAIVHGVWTYASIAGAQGCKDAGLPYILLPHGMLDPYFRKSKPIKHWVKQVFWLAQGRALRDAFSVVFTCEEERDLARGAFWGPKYREMIARLGIKLPPVDIDEHCGNALRAHVPGLRDAPYLLFLSRLHPKKGADLLIEGFAKISEDFPNIHLVIAGSGEKALTDALKDRVDFLELGNRIHFAGLITGTTKWSALKGAQALCLWTHQENFGLVLAEALSVGCPVLTTDKTNIHAQLSRTGAALIGKDTAQNAEDTLRRFLNLPPQTQARMKEAAITGFRKEFCLDETIGDLIAILELACASKERKDG